LNLPVLATILDADDRPARLAEMFTAAGERSDHTRAAYRIDLTGCSYRLGQCKHPKPDVNHLHVAWLPWCSAEGVDPLGRVRHAAVQAWLADLAATPSNGEPTRARRLAAVSSWYRWLIREEVVERNPADLHTNERPRASAKVHEVSPIGNLTVAASGALLAAADADRNPVAAPLLHTLATTGARVSEVLGANTDDIGWPSGHPAIMARGKGGKVRPLPLAPSVYDRVREYLATRPDSAGGLPALPDEAGAPRPLFTTRNGERLSRQAAHSLLRRLAKVAGLGEVNGDVCAHMLRHSYATDLLAEGVPLRDVQYAMGHADPRTTERYDHGRLDLDRHPTYRRAAQLSKGAS
jgi:integrase/recombinase XerD